MPVREYQGGAMSNIPVTAGKAQKLMSAIMNSRLFRRRVGTTGMMQYDAGLKSDGIRDAVRQKSESMVDGM